jgi:hypothetical protein
VEPEGSENHLAAAAPFSAPGSPTVLTGESTTHRDSPRSGDEASRLGRCATNRVNADSARARRMKGRWRNEAWRRQHVAIPMRRAIRAARTERAVFVAEAWARGRSDTPHSATRDARLVHSRRRVVASRRPGIDRCADRGRCAGDIPVGRQGGARDADAGPQRREKRRERAQPTERGRSATSAWETGSELAHDSYVIGVVPRLQAPSR